jgi:diacylglycerol kinase (ATP)
VTEDRLRSATPDRRAGIVVIVNPVKVPDVTALRARVEDRVRDVDPDGNLVDVTWTETTEDDPGTGQARAAVEADATLVIAVGGDGTVTACAAALADTGVALGIVPAGTGNLLARNLALPLQIERAVDVAIGGVDRHIDVLQSGDETYVVAAGLGLDAALIRDTDENLKARIGWLTYIGGARRAILGTPRQKYTVTFDGGASVIEQRAVGVVVANVGGLTGGLTLLTDARPDDGRFDVLILSPHRRFGHWASLLVRVALRRLHDDARVHITQATEVMITTNEPAPVQFDGEHRGERRELSVKVRPGALVVRCADPA